MFEFLKFKNNWKSLAPSFLFLSRAIAQKLREVDADTIGGDDEVAEAIEYACERVENLIKAKAGEPVAG